MFEKLDSNKAYILGFISADGCNEGRTVSIQLQERDSYILENISNIFRENGYNPKLKHYSRSFTLKDGSIHYYSRLRINSIELCKELTNIGIMSNKSLILKLLDIPKEYMTDFIRGYFDGDGNVGCKVSKTNYTNTYTTFYSGSFDFLNGLENWISNNLNLSNKEIKSKKGKVYYLTYCTIESNILREAMYNTDSSLYLERKKLDIYTYIPKINSRHWTENDLNYLTANYDSNNSTISKEQISKVLNKTTSSVHNKLVRLNLLPKRQ